MPELAPVGGKEPVLINQPEDYRNNRSICQGVVRQIARISQRRQLIAATHNADIPVLGDAELILASTPPPAGEPSSPAAAWTTGRRQDCPQRPQGRRRSPSRPGADGTYNPDMPKRILLLRPSTVCPPG